MLPLKRQICGLDLVWGRECAVPASGYPIGGEDPAQAWPPHSQYLKRAIFISLPNAETEPSSIAKGVSCLLTPLLIFLFLPAENSRLENLRQEAQQHCGKVKDRYSSAPRAQGMNRLISSSQKPHS